MLIGPVSGAAKFLTADDCARRCADEHDTSQPASTGDTCPWCMPLRALVSAPTAPAADAPLDTLAAESVQAPASPDPRDIAHVPKPVA